MNMTYTTLGRTGLKVSRIGLGTAEIGFSYGIGERPLPSEAEAIDLLKKSVDLGITFFDTASYYGVAEERIGKSGILKNPDIIVETKCAQFLEKGEKYALPELTEKITVQVDESLKKLRIDSLPILMLHGPSVEDINRGELTGILKDLKQAGKIRFTGVSTRGEESPLAAINSGFFDVIQVAYNIPDQRMEPKVFPTAQKAGVGIINRSVLLKGSLTALRTKLPAGLEGLQQTVDEIEAIAREIGTDLPTLAIRFALNNPCISSSLIGTNKLGNVEKAIRALEAGPLPPEIAARLHKVALNTPNQVDPAQWPKLQ
jgi:aryl-alcohol dehydrogenase-like predicted oxidoreductase